MAMAGRGGARGWRWRGEERENAKLVAHSLYHHGESNEERERRSSSSSWEGVLCDAEREIDRERAMAVVVVAGMSDTEREREREHWMMIIIVDATEKRRTWERLRKEGLGSD